MEYVVFYEYGVSSAGIFSACEDLMVGGIARYVCTGSVFMVISGSLVSCMHVMEGLRESISGFRPVVWLDFKPLMFHWRIAISGLGLG